MRIKTLVILSVLALLIGGVAGGGYAFISQEKTLPNNQLASQKPLTEEEKNEALLDNFIAEQEEEHPDGLIEATVEVGSKYDGITYNNVTPATNNNTSAATEKKDNTSSEDKKETADNKESNVNNTGESSIWEGTAGGQQVGMVDISSSSSLNIRQKPGMDGQIIGKLYKDNEVLVVGKDGNWYKIVTGDGVEGYVSADYLKIVD